jgi:hypothetical protein
VPLHAQPDRPAVRNRQLWVIDAASNKSWGMQRIKEIEIVVQPSTHSKAM